MTSPGPAQDDQSQQQDGPPEEDSSLLPALLAAYAAYLAWHGAHDRLPSGWKQVVLALGLQGLIGGALAMSAVRGLTWQQQQSGRSGDDLWPHMDDAVKTGVNAGLQTVAEALLWTDQQVGHGQTPTTKDDASGPEPSIVPTASNPPSLLAQMAATATVNAAIFAAAVAAGWTKKTWNSQEDARVRDTHRVLNGTAVPMASTFTSPSGAKLRFPGDPRAPMDERAGCRCYLKMSRR